jgi:L-rhamnose mutarotase
MRTFAQCLDLKDDPRVIAEYRDWHTRVWPEVMAALHRLGVRDMKIYLHGARLFMVYQAPDGFDPARDYQDYAKNPRVAEWDALMRGFQRPSPGAAPGAWWSPMELVFDLEVAAAAAGV